jgi:hypothetical protein
MHVQAATLADWHEYAVAWEGADLRFLLDGMEVYRSVGQGDPFPEPRFAVLNVAKINAAAMTVPSWTMEVDWVKHERRRAAPAAAPPPSTPYTSAQRAASRAAPPAGHRASTGGGRRSARRPEARCALLLLPLYD